MPIHRTPSRVRFRYDEFIAAAQTDHGAQPVRDFQHRFQAEGPDAVFSRTRFLLRLNRQNVREHRGGLNPDPKNLDAMQAILEDRARLIQRDQYRMAA